MATISYGLGQTIVNLHFEQGNEFVATLQCAAARRFDLGKGFFLTLAGHGDDGQSVTRANWISAGTPLQFIYDTEDLYGNPVDTVIVQDEVVDSFLSAMDNAIGVVWGFSIEQQAYVPFMTEEHAAEAERRRQQPTSSEN